MKRHIARENTQSSYGQYSNVSPHGMIFDLAAAETTFVTSIGFNHCRGLKWITKNSHALLRDQTAYDEWRVIMRGRRLHTRGRAEKLHRDSKGANLKKDTPRIEVFGTKDTAIPPSRVQRKVKTVSLVTSVKKEILSCKNAHGTYNGLINILGKPEFLVACYEEIKGKPGNMTKGDSEETLDGLTWE